MRFTQGRCSSGRWSRTFLILCTWHLWTGTSFPSTSATPARHACDPSITMTTRVPSVVLRPRSTSFVRGPLHIGASGLALPVVCCHWRLPPFLDSSDLSQRSRGPLLQIPRSLGHLLCRGRNGIFHRRSQWGSLQNAGEGAPSGARFAKIRPVWLGSRILTPLVQSPATPPKVGSISAPSLRRSCGLAPRRAKKAVLTRSRPIGVADATLTESE